MLRVPVRSAPFRLSSFVWESQPGRYALTVVAQGTAKLVLSGEATWLDDPSMDPGYDESQISIARANLVAPFKPRVDVVVIGRAYAPPGGDAERLVARVRIGDFVKAISVTGDRLWVREAGRWGSSHPRPFSQMLLAPERGLRSAENPIGLDPAQIPIEGRLALPNFEAVAGSYSSIIGPIPANAPSRLNLLTPVARQWLHALELGQRGGPVPEGFHFAFFNVAPSDQQVNEVAPGAAVVLENLHPSHPMFTSRLPLTVPRLTALDPGTGARIDLATRLDTVWLDGDREVATMTFRATGEVTRPDLAVPVSVELEAPSPPKRPTLTNVQMLATQQGAPPPASGALPFAGSTPTRPAGFPAWLPASEVATGPAGFGYAHPGARAVRDEPTADLRKEGSYPPPPPPRQRSITAEIPIEQDAGLPFDAPTHAWDQGATTNELMDPATPVAPARDTAPPPPPAAGDGEAMPFSLSPMSVTRPVALTRVPEVPSPPPPPMAPPAVQLVPIGEPGPIPDIGPTLAPELPPEPIAEPAEPAAAAAVPAPALDASPLRIPIAPPPTVQIPDEPSSSDLDATFDPDAARAALDQTPNAPETSAADALASEPTPAAERPAVRESVTLEEAAAIRAELSAKSADRAAILARWGLTDDSFARLERDKLRALDEASSSGSTAVLDSYDDAYLEAVSRTRAPLNEVAYARLQVARESGTLAAVLDELSLSRAELMRVERVWRRRLAADKDLAERVEDEMERLRSD